MRDEQKTRGLLMADLSAARERVETAERLVRAAEYAFSHLPFDHAERRDVLARMRAFLHLPATGSTSGDVHALRRN